MAGEHHHNQHHEHHRHDGPHDHARHDDRRRLALTVGLSVGILLAEVVGGLLSHSLALLSDAGHMLSDVGAQVLSLVALAIATRPADARRTYGFYRIEILAALANGVALVLIAVLIFWSGYERLRAGVPVIHIPVMVGIAGIGLVANLGGAWLLHDADSLNVKGAYLHILTDTVSSGAVLVGGFVMWIAGGLYILDPLLSMAIGLFITYTAFRLVREAVDILLEAVPVDVNLRGVMSALGGVDGVSGVHDLHIWTITSGMRALSAHLVVDGAALARSDDVLARVKAILAGDFGIAHTTIQIESAAYEIDGRSCGHCLPSKAHST